MTLKVLKNHSKEKLPLRIYIFTFPLIYFIFKKSCLGKRKKKKSKDLYIRQHSALRNIIFEIIGKILMLNDIKVILYYEELKWKVRCASARENRK